MTIRRKLILAPLLFLLLLGVVKSISISFENKAMELFTWSHSLEHQAILLERMFRGINDSILTDGTPRSIRIVTTARDTFEQKYQLCPIFLQKHAAFKASCQQINSLWKEIRDEIDPFLVENSVSADDDQLMRRYGALLVKAERLINNVTKLEEEIAGSAKKAHRKADTTNDATMAALIIGTLLLFFQLYRTISLPISCLHREMEQLSRGPESLSERLRTYHGSIAQRSNALIDCRGNELGDLTKSFDLLISTVRNYLQQRDEALDEVEKFNLGLEQLVKERAAELDEQKTLFEAIFCGVPDAMVLANSEREIMLTNPALTRIFGYDLAEIKGKQTAIFYESREEFERQGRIRFNPTAEEMYEPYEVGYRRKDGELFPGEAVGTVIRDEEGSVLGFLVVMRNITERKQAEEKLRRYEQIVSATEDHMSFIGPDYTYQAVNDAYIQAHQRARQETIGYSVADLFGVAIFERCIKEKLDRCLAGEEINYEWWFNFPVLGRRCMDVSYYPFIAYDGEITGVVVSSHDITNRKHTEDTLRQSEETNRAIIETSQDWIWAIDLDGRHTYSNPAVEAILGYTTDEIIGGQSLDLMHADDRKLVQDNLGEWVQKQQGWSNLVIRWHHKDGGYRYLESNAVPSLNAEGKLVGFRGVDRDITERKRTEESLLESETKYRLAMEATQDGLWDWDVTTENVYYSPWWNHILGEEHIQNNYSTWEDRIHLEDKLRISDSLRSHLAGETTVWQEEHRLRKADGTWIWVLGRGRVVERDNQGNPLRMVGTMTDITERKQAEERLRQAATVFENATDGVIITDTQGAIVTINQAVTKITGYSEAEVLGKNPSIWKSDRHGPAFFQEMWASLEQHDQWRGEIWNRRKSGEIFPCWQSISAVRDDDTGEIKHYVSIMSDITAIKESQERLQHLAHHDPLTNLPNRLLFNARLEHAMERAHREKCSIGVMFLDLDNFKPINDGLGHPVGDKVLQAVAERLTAQVREEDTVARISGDEFAIILEEISDSQDIAHVAAKILSSFEIPFHIEGQELHVTTSIGISLYPENGKDVTTLVKNADAAMYRAKEQGKNRYCFYTLDLTEAALERLQLENDLRVALKRNEFTVYYQPQYSLDTGQLVGAEALVRWQHPEMGLVPPIKFISLAENTGLIIPIGRWVLREACAQTKAWQDAGLDFGRIGVNVAGQQIQSSDIVQTVREVLEQTGLEPQYLELEVTESFIMQQADEAISTLEELRGLGVALAIDDFGTGYSSLSYLKRLPIDKLKIDRSFIKDIPQDTDDEAITRAIIALGKSLQLKIIAEGVETQEQNDFVSLEGCDEVQGFLYSRPVPAQELEAVLQAKNNNL